MAVTGFVVFVMFRGPCPCSFGCTVLSPCFKSSFSFSFFSPSLRLFCFSSLDIFTSDMSVSSNVQLRVCSWRAALRFRFGSDAWYARELGFWDLQISSSDDVLLTETYVDSTFQDYRYPRGDLFHDLVALEGNLPRCPVEDIYTSCLPQVLA